MRLFLLKMRVFLLRHWLLPTEIQPLLFLLLPRLFDLSSKIISLLSVTESGTAFEQPQGVPSIPSDTTQPYDIIDNVITKAFDRASFIEFYKT